jgi:hypothetical protein
LHDSRYPFATGFTCALLLSACLLAGPLVSGQQTPASKPDDSKEPTDLTFLLYSFPNRTQQELVVTDPEGKSVGKDALTGRSYKSAGNASYSLEGQEDLGVNVSAPAVKSIRFTEPLDGWYHLRITANTPGTFDLYVTGDCGSTVRRTNITRQALNAGVPEMFSLRFNHEHCSEIKLIRSVRKQVEHTGSE